MMSVWDTGNVAEYVRGFTLSQYIMFLDEYLGEAFIEDISDNEIFYELNSENTNIVVNMGDLPDDVSHYPYPIGEIIHTFETDVGEYWDNPRQLLDLHVMIGKTKEGFAYGIQVYSPKMLHLEEGDHIEKIPSYLPSFGIREGERLSPYEADIMLISPEAAFIILSNIISDDVPMTNEKGEKMYLRLGGKKSARKVV